MTKANSCCSKYTGTIEIPFTFFFHGILVQAIVVLAFEVNVAGMCADEHTSLKANGKLETVITVQGICHIAELQRCFEISGVKLGLFEMIGIGLILEP